MQMTISHPTDRPNYSEVTIGDVELIFSYRTLIAFRTPETGRYVVRENDWGPTTGRHLNHVPGGHDKAARIPSADFVAMVDRYVVGPYNLAPQVAQ